MSERALIVGCGIAGMATALALARRGKAVTLLERDPPPPPGDADAAFFDWPRRGALQFRHPHAFLGLMCNLLADRYPDLLDALYAAGARRLDFKAMLPPNLVRGYRPKPSDAAIWGLLTRRAVFETVLRRHIQQTDNVTIINGITINGLIVNAANDPIEVQGVGVRRDCVAAHGPELRANLVIDASGRTSRFPGWLAACGAPPEEENEDAEIVYYTRHYRRRPGVEEPPRDGKHRGNGDLGYIKYGVFPGDNRHFAIIVCLHREETRLRAAVKDGSRFDAICRSIPGLTPWLADAPEATTPPFGIGDIRGVRRRYVKDGKPQALNFFAVGDAALRTNPLYGRGCSTGILHAELLAETLAETADPQQRALAFERRTDAELGPIFRASRSEDRAGIRRSRAFFCEGQAPRAGSGQLPEEAGANARRARLAFGDALAAASRNNLHVLRGLLRTVHLLEAPGHFLKDRRTRLIIMLYMLRGRRRNAAARWQQGPSREEMLALVD
ncbi:MAG: FAD-dependent oxidoreductase [Gammaproteobacteria bacterium]|nr:FAD-dependent oxidoreductase [Gammaproteobacteria bacterium]